MDYFGQLVDDLTDMQERIQASPHAVDAGKVLKALHRAMMAAVEVERGRMAAARLGLEGLIQEEQPVQRKAA